MPTPMKFSALWKHIGCLALCLSLQMMWGLPALASPQSDTKSPRRPRTMPQPQIPLPEPSDRDSVKNKDSVQEPDMKVQSIRVEEVGLTVADLMVTVEIYNPHSDLTISNLKFRVKLNGLESGEGSYNEKIKLPAKGAVTLNLPLTVDLTALPGVGVNGVLNGVRLDYEVNSEFDVSVFIFKKHARKTMTGNVPIRAALPRITLPRITLPGIIFP